MMFLRPCGGRLSISESALALLRDHAQRDQRAPEAGGILLGRWMTRSQDVLIDSITLPTRKDRRSRFSFFRAKAPAQLAVIRAWKLSGGEENYLGEWHTHPEDDPSPSMLDTTEWRRMVKTVSYEQESLFFIIVGRTSLRAWEFERHSSSCVLMKPIGKSSVDTD